MSIELELALLVGVWIANFFGLVILGMFINDVLRHRLNLK